MQWHNGIIFMQWHKGGEKMKPRKGRPPKNEESRSVNLQLRLTPTAANMLAESAEALNTSRTDVIEQGIRLVHEKVVKEK